MIITPDLLRAWMACTPQLDLFTEEYPKGVELTRQLLVDRGRSYDLSWLASQIILGEARGVYLNATAAARKVNTLAACDAWEAFVGAGRTTAALAVHGATMEAAAVVYHQQVANALADALRL